MNRILNTTEAQDLASGHRPKRRYGISMALIRKGKQFTWHRKDLIGLRELSTEEILHILDTAKGFEQFSTRSIKKAMSFWNLL